MLFTVTCLAFVECTIRIRHGCGNALLQRVIGARRP